MSKKAPTFILGGDELRKIYRPLFQNLSVESPVDSREGVQDTSTAIPVNNWFGMPPQPRVLWVKVYPNCA
jgi:hypothetical protein